MKNFVFICLLTFFSFNSLAQYSLDTTLKKSQLIGKSTFKNENQYFVGGEKVKKLKPYLLAFPESTLEYKKSRTNLTATIISMGVGLVGITTIFLSKDEKTSKIGALYINIPALVGMIYFGINAKRHLNKSIDNYNKKVSLY